MRFGNNSTEILDSWILGNINIAKSFSDDQLQC